jgi:dTDP-4-amino-4,6-dideoxygalactose transaminase
MLHPEQTAPRPATAARPLIPLVDLRAQFARLREEIGQALEVVAESGVYTLGPKVAAFEEAFAAYTGARHCIGVNSGTSALHLALLGAGVAPGDEVITVPMTFIATAWAISYVGATPVFVDIDPVTRTMDPRQVERRLTHKTRALLPVHLYGQAADLAPLLDLARRHGIPVIEDAAQAHAARYQGSHVGTFGLCGCFSFYPGKNLGAYGEAGAVLTDDDRIATRLRALRDHAQEARYQHAEVGFNYRMEAFQGAILEVKLRYLDRWTEARTFLAARYRKHLAELPLELPVEAPDRQHAWHLFVVLHPNRDHLRRELEARGIATGLHYPIPLHLQKAYQHLGHVAGAFPEAERVGRQCLSLPLYPELTVQQQDRIVEAIEDIVRGEQWR